MQKTLLLLAATALVAATPAADLDQNGEVSRAEFMAASDARFTAADTNFDGQLSRDEMRALGETKRTEHARERHAAMDTDGDGSVSEAEMLAARDARGERREGRNDDRREAMMERFDTNADGEISDAERAVARELAQARRGERRAQREVRRNNRSERPRSERPRLDADRDGFVSRAEYDAMGDALFARMDANGDGVLTQGEGRQRKGRREGPQSGPRR